MENREISFELEEVGLDPELEVAIEGSEVTLELPAMNPKLVKMYRGGERT